MFCVSNRWRAGRTFYEILSVSRLSKPEEIRASYLALAKRYHPDSAVPSTVDAEVKFREIQEAYSTLSNSWKRTLYDQDLQFQTAVALTGTNSEGVASWRENFNLETPEARLARRERYRRYARGERTDLPPVQLTTRACLIGLVVCGTVLTWVCAKAPEWFGGQGELDYHDPVSDDKSVALVRAYFNPITKLWERLSDEHAPPTLPQLVTQYAKFAPRVVDRWKRLELESGSDVGCIEALTVANVPKTKSVPATVFVQSEELRLNRRTLNDAISKFVDRLD